MQATPSAQDSPAADRPAPRRGEPPRARGVVAIGRLLRRAWSPLFWCAAATAAASLWFSGGAQPHALALGTSAELHLAPAVAGRILTVDVVTGQTVRAGDQLATLDTAEVDARLALAYVELERARARVAAERDELRLAQSDRRAQAAARRASFEGDGRRLRNLVDGLATQQATAQAELAALAPQIARLESLVAQQLATADRIDELLQRRAVLEERVTGRGAELDGAHEELAAWARLVPAEPDSADPGAAMQPYELALRAEEASVAVLVLERARCTLAAPADGTVSAILARSGEWRAAGEPIVRLILPGTGRVEAWIGERQLAAVTVGTRVSLRPRGSHGAVHEGAVVAMAPLIEEMPPQLWSLPGQRLWGRRVTIEFDDRQEALPGTVHDVRFQ